MKKIIYTLLVAVLALSFMGCPTVYEDLKPQVDLSSFYLRGNMNNWCNDALEDGALTANDDGTFSITYTAKAAGDEFAIANEGWSSKFCGKEVAVDGDFVKMEPGAGNAKVTGQVPGNNYKMTIKPLSDTVEVKVELAGVNVPSFYVLDGNEGLIEMPYDGTAYSYKFTATGDTETLCIWSNNVYYTGTAVLGTAKTLTKADEIDGLTVTGLEADLKYLAKITVSDKGVATIKVEAFTSPYFIVGAPTFELKEGSFKDENYFVALELTDEEGIFTYEFTYKTAMSAHWTSPANGVAFVITERVDWNKKFCDVEIGSTFKESGTNGDNNAVAKNLVDGKTYIITLKEADGKFSAKIAEKQ